MRTLAPRTVLASLALLAGASLPALFLLASPVVQAESYHLFADRRTMLGIPNALDVLSNLPFLLVGGGGLAVVWRRGPGAVFVGPWERGAFTTLFAAVIATACGSVYYHLAPSTSRLFWDRLPLALVFSAIFGLVIAETAGTRTGRKLFLPLVAAGAASVLAWRVTGDLRLYGFVQFFPLVALPLLFALGPGCYDRRRDLVAMLVLYAAAKLAELLDERIFLVGRLVSGHTLKHVLAAAALAMWLPHLRHRRPLPGSDVRG